MCKVTEGHTVCNLGSRSECYGAQIEYEREKESDSDQNQETPVGTRIEGDKSTQIKILWVRWRCALVWLHFLGLPMINPQHDVTITNVTVAS